jgi:putative membrane protein
VAIADLPGLNATLNAISATFLVIGYILIRNGRRQLHKGAMLAALTSSALFLTSYLIYHYYAGSRPFTRSGAIAWVYYTILISHVLLAMTILPLALVTTARGLMSQYSRHVKVARWTLPIWLYVSVTGVIVYWMLYRL